MFSHDSVRFRHLVLGHCSIVTHINPKGGRFNDGLFGAFYLASREQTAALEVKHHQQRYWANVEGPVVTHSAAPIHKVRASETEFLDPHSYVASQQLARELKKKRVAAVEYPSVRADGTCWALFTPKPIDDIVQSYLLEMIWDGEKIAEVNEVNHIDI
ncbi:RES family NAD+ phosphorylase [Vibrio vulnificus]|uniref:RES family NAD+ phosphorylase n=1 Tax=Vibrio vulnificus TaxID=672 RepID=UPI0021DA9DD2|nr:RES family NAD+ phosphorylase [Vibrio vulnificus]MCU8331329.1 RES family NAD+ phosphorylase [Vibrio vulnificus]MCU8410081.1 RES family NAD+ phosphorylase [Vibrio vulnificus]MDK2622156.1 RES family NAD+ phosphorylase [Vibrio vulnificus]